MAKRTNDFILVEAKVIKDGRVQLDFMQHSPNPHKKTSSSASSAILQAMNQSDDRFDNEGGGTGNYHYYTNGVRADVEASWGIDLSGLATTLGAVLPLNIVNPKFKDIKGISHDVCLKVVELKASEMRTFFSPKKAQEIGASIMNPAINVDWKRKGKGGAYILSAGEKIFTHTDIDFGTEPQHRFLPMDAEVQVLTPPVAQQQMQAVPQQAPAQQQQSMQPADDLPF